MKINDFNKGNTKVLVQIFLTEYGDRDILRCVYFDIVTGLLSTLDIVKDGRDFPNKDDFLEVVINNFGDKINLMEFHDPSLLDSRFLYLVKQYRLVYNGIIYFDKKRGRRDIFIGTK